MNTQDRGTYNMIANQEVYLIFLVLAPSRLYVLDLTRRDFSLFSGNAGLSQVSTTIKNGALLSYKAVNLIKQCNHRPSVADKQFNHGLTQISLITPI